MFGAQQSITHPMKILSLLLALFGGLAFAAVAAEKPARSTRLLHVVSFKFKAAAKPEQIEQVVAAFRNLKRKIPGIKKFEWGTNISPEKHDKGFTHGFILTFKSEKERDDYLVHPEHKAFGQLLGPILEEVFVIDYWAQE